MSLPVVMLLPRQSVEQHSLRFGQFGLQPRPLLEQGLRVGEILEALRAPMGRIGAGPQLLVQQVDPSMTRRRMEPSSSSSARSMAATRAGSSVNWTGVPSGPSQFSEWLKRPRGVKPAARSSADGIVRKLVTARSTSSVVRGSA